MTCETSIESTPQVSPRTFDNWSKKHRYSSQTSYRPSTKGEIVQIIQNAERDPNGKVKWTGSKWSFMRTFECNDVLIESDDIFGLVEINQSNADPEQRQILRHINLTSAAREQLDRGLLVHIKGGTKIFNVNRLLHGLPLIDNNVLHDIPADEENLQCAENSRAMPTLGGSGGQAIAGAISTGTHGGDIQVSPVADHVVAIHLIGPGGQEWWIERCAGITAGTEMETQQSIADLAATFDDAESEICSDVIVKKDDDFFHAVMVSLGRMGFIYSLVVEVEPAFKLTERRTRDVWESFRNNLITDDAFQRYTNSMHYLNIVIMPYSNNRNEHACIVSTRTKQDGNCEDLDANELGDPAGLGGDVITFACGLTDVRPILLALLAVLSSIALGISLTIPPLLAIPFVGWALAGAAIAALAVVTSAVMVVTGLLLLANIRQLTVRELIAELSKIASNFRLSNLVITALTELFNLLYTTENADGSPYLRRNFSWKIMDTYGYATDDQCQKVESMDFAFDPSVRNSSGVPSYMSFIDRVLFLFEEFRIRNIIVGGNFALRFSKGTQSLLGMSKYDTTLHVEIAALRGMAGTAEFVERVQSIAKSYNAIPSWGQLFNHYNGAEIRDLHGDKLRRWREVLTALINQGGGRNETFSNSFTQLYKLEPLETTPLTSLTLQITVGDDALGDTAWPFRTERSKDYVTLAFVDGTNIETELNYSDGEWVEWSAYSTHSKTITFGAGIFWHDIESIIIRHEAAGPDIAADNWTMDKIVITTLSATGETKERYNPSNQTSVRFLKNDENIWKYPES